MNPTRITKKPVFGLFVLLMLCVSLAFAGLTEKEKAQTQGVHKTNGNDLYRPFLINNVFNYYGNNGDGSFNKFSTNNEGFEFFKGSGKTAIFEDGVVWGGYHKGYTVKNSNGVLVPQAKVGGSTYRHGLSAGPILQYGTATTDPVADVADNPANRIYRVRPDIGPNQSFADVQSKIQSDEVPYVARYEGFSASDIYNQYVADWNEWPAAEGAPFTYGIDVTQNPPVKRKAPLPYDPRFDTPGQPGSDQTLWYVSNDCNASRTASLAGSPVIGLEMRRTIWGYKRKGALGQTIFASTVLINKSGAKIDTMFMVQWADPDLGDGGDDFAGCDTTRSLGFIYNGAKSDAVYGTAIPSAGFDFFQGPVVPGAPTDTAIFQLRKRAGYKNLPMSTFDFFSQGFAQYADPTLGAGGDIQWYRLMNGLIAATGAPFIDPVTNLPTKFCLYGDPTKSQTGAAGWVDGMNGLTPQDRRICLVTGPFTMAPGDTQELVVGLTGGLGSDFLSSINVLKLVDDQVQIAYNGLFDLPSPPPAPIVSVAALDGEIVLSWGDTVTVKKTEGSFSQGFTFEGYNVYEFPTSANQNPILLGTWDLVDGVRTISDTAFDPPSGLNLIQPIVLAKDNGIIHSIDLTSSKVTGGGLVNGTTYYLGVTAFSYNANPPATAGTHSLESSPQVLAIMPHSANPGTRVNSAYNKSLPVTHVTGLSSATPTVTVVDPGTLPPANYEIRIAVTDSVFSADLGVNVANPRWQVYDVTNNKIAIPNQLDYSAGASAGKPIGAGVQVGVLGSPFYIAGQELASLTWAPSGNFNFTGVNATPYPGDGFINSILAPQDVSSDVQMEIVDTVKNSTKGQKAYDFIRTGSSGSAGAPYAGFFPQPFKVYSLNQDGTRRRQIDFVFMEVIGSAYLDSVWAPGAASGDREYWFFIDEGYTATEKAKYAGTTMGNALGADSCVWSGWYTLTNAAKKPYKLGDIWTIKTTKIVKPDDKWSFSTVGVAAVTSTAAAKLDVTKVNVYPNPYLGFNPLETNKYARYVTFTHLPTSATIRIFTLSGTLVRTIIKNDPSQFLQWDLNNEKGFPVAAGMYIAYIDMKDLGTKTLKLGVIPEQQYLDRW